MRTDFSASLPVHPAHCHKIAQGQKAQQDLYQGVTNSIDHKNIQSYNSKYLEESYQSPASGLNPTCRLKELDRDLPGGRLFHNCPLQGFLYLPLKQQILATVIDRILG